MITITKCVYKVAYPKNGNVRRPTHSYVWTYPGGGPFMKLSDALKAVADDYPEEPVALAKQKCTWCSPVCWKES